MLLPDELLVLNEQNVGNADTAGTRNLMDA